MHNSALCSQTNPRPTTKFSSRFKALCLISATAVTLSTAAFATPQLSPKFVAAQSTVSTTTSLNYPYRVAVDSTGDIYISDTQNNRVVKEAFSNGVYTETVVQAGLSTPYGVAVDSTGVVYIVDNGNVRIVMDTPNGSGGYNETIIPTSALTYPTGIAVDSSFNVYITDTGHGRVLKETPAGGGTYTESVVHSTGLPQPTGVAVDSAGNVFVSDIDEQAIFMETPSSGSYTQSTVPTSGLNYPYDVTVDSNDNLYIANFADDQIVKETNNSGSYSQTIFPTANLTGPLGVAVDPQGDLFIADTFGFEIKKSILAGGNFYSVNVGSSAGPVYELFQFSGGSPGTSVQMTGYDVLTQGTAKLDFSDAGSSSCTAAYYHSGDFCAVSVNFSPRFPGQRDGSVKFRGTTYNSIATGFISGTGTAPQLSFLPGNPSFVAGSPAPFDLSNPFASAEDAAGNVYVADYNNNAVYKESYANHIYTQSTVVTGLNNPEDVAVDGEGNIYVVDSGNNQVLKESYFGGVYHQQTVASSLDFPTGIAIDANGNVYISSFGDGAVYLETLTNGFYTQSTVVSGLNEPRKLAVDSSGNVYITDTGSSTVVKETWTGSGYTQSTLGGDMLYPYGVAVDAAGNVYVADTVNHRVLLEALSGGTYTQYTLYPGATLYGITVGGDGSLYVADAETAAIYKLTLTNPGGLSFESTAVGETSLDSPQTVTVLNSGNAALTIPVPDSGLNPSLSPAYTLDDSTTCPQASSSGSPASIGTGVYCQYAIDFSPTNFGSFNGSLVLVDNNLNLNAMQSVSISGTGTEQTQTINFTAPTSPVAVNTTPITLTATGGPSGNPVIFSIVGNGPGTISGNQLTVTGPGYIVIAANQAGGSGYFKATQVEQHILVNRLTQTISITPIASPNYVGGTVTLSAAATSGLAVSFVSVHPSICSVSESGGIWTASLLTVGGCSIEAQQGGNATYAGAPQASENFFISPNSQSITLGAVETPAYAGSSVMLLPSATSGLPVTLASSTGSICTVSQPGGVGTAWTVNLVARGRCTLVATQPGNTTYAKAAPVTYTFTISGVSQSIIFPAISEPVSAGSSVPLTATATSGLAVSYVSVHPSICTVSASGGVWSVNLIAAGGCSVEAEQGGNSTYAGATAVFQNFFVHPQS